MHIHHLLNYVDPSKFDAEVEFYEKSLAHCGVKKLLQPLPNVIGLGVDRCLIWITSAPDAHSVGFTPHFAIDVDSREQVQEFHRTALEIGAKDNGGPGLRPEYTSGYYAAFVISPGGYNVEVVHHTRE